MKKMVKVAALVAMVVSVALTGCNGKKGEASSSKTEASAKSKSKASSRKQIDSLFKDYEKIIKKAENAAKKGDKASLTSLRTEAEKLCEKLVKLRDASEWSDSDTMKFLELNFRYNAAESKLSN